MSEDNKQQPAQLNIEISEEVAEGNYSNLAIITHSHAEFVIDFVNVMPGTPKSKVKSRAVLLMGKPETTVSTTSTPVSVVSRSSAL